MIFQKQTFILNMADKDGNYVCRWNKTTGCTYMTKIKSEILQHAKHVHGYDPIYACPECGKKYTRDVLLRNHMSLRHAINRKPGPYNGLYTCHDDNDKCGKQFPTMKKLRAHKKKEHQHNDKQEEPDIVVVE
jgi:glycyl-tRNA synthetase (class II)